MRKRVIGQEIGVDVRWLDLDKLAQVEVTSEDPANPIERPLEGGGHWRAAGEGEQVIRLLFDEPATIRSIYLRFDETGESRTQEFVLRWSADRGQSYRDIVRQQFTFSPPETTNEKEYYRVELNGLTDLMLRVVPNISGGASRATLSEWRMA